MLDYFNKNLSLEKKIEMLKRKGFLEIEKALKILEKINNSEALAIIKHIEFSKNRNKNIILGKFIEEIFMTYTVEYIEERSVRRIITNNKRVKKFF